MPAMTSTSEIGSPSAQCAASGYRASAACHRSGSRSARSARSRLLVVNTTLQVRLSPGSVMTVRES
jgi:hypothetical protein